MYFIMSLKEHTILASLLMKVFSIYFLLLLHIFIYNLYFIVIAWALKCSLILILRSWIIGSKTALKNTFDPYNWNPDEVIWTPTYSIWWQIFLCPLINLHQFFKLKYNATNFKKSYVQLKIKSSIWNKKGFIYLMHFILFSPVYLRNYFNIW